MGSFQQQFDGRMQGVLAWDDLDRLWARLRAAADDRWFVYAIGEEVPTRPVSVERWLKSIAAIDALLRKDHDEEYCGIVFVDSVETPTLVKVFDPNNLGASCGSSGMRVLPGWVMSRTPPTLLEPPVPPPAGRRRWWRALFG